MDDIKNAEDVFEMDGKTLEELCKKHPHNMAVYMRKLQEAKSMEDFVKMKLDEITSKLWKKYNEGYSMKLTSKDMQMYIQGDQEYTQMLELQLEVTFIKKQLESIVDTFVSMGYSLNNITKIRVAELQNAIL